MKPIIKWPGSKRRLIKEINNSFENDNNSTIYEPFAGGMAFSLSNKAKRYVINDLNKKLINLYKCIQQDYQQLNQILSNGTFTNNSDVFYAKRSEFNSVKIDSDELDFNDAANFIFLNKTCFNGMYRVNSQGKYNVPFGKYKNPHIPTLNELREFSKHISEFEFHSTDYKELLKEVDTNSIIYLDPPYMPKIESSKFIGYTDPRFVKESHQELANISIRLAAKGNKVLISNSHNVEFRRMFKSDASHFKFRIINVTRYVNPESKNNIVKEYLVISK